MTASEIRRSFLEFFRSKDHLVLPSASLVPTDETSLLMSAGVQPFINAFRGIEAPPAPRVATCQKCARAGDIENVGRTARHHTFFEMLGNFSFGDYFKRGAIEYAWELSTEVWDLPREDIWVSIYEEDDEAADIWHEVTGIPREKIIRLGKKDNWWPQVRWEGPCGPCSELYLDMGPEVGCGRPDCRPGCDCDRFMEYWNLVFQQFTESEDGVLTPLPAPGIDTGMGLERIATLMQGVSTVFDTDELRRILDYVIQMAQQATDGRYQYSGGSAETDVASRIITDHVRAATFLMADGVMPSNEGRGYVLRRLIRRAYRFGRLIGLVQPFLYRAVPVVTRVVVADYPELAQKQELTVRVLRREEERFQATLEQGMHLFEKVAARLAEKNETVFPGADAFTLYDTYGFPLDMTVELAAERGLSVDQAGFESAMAQQRARSQVGPIGLEGAEAALDLGDVPPTQFVGYDTIDVMGRVVAILVEDRRADSVKAGERARVALDRTPFYAEKGGQVGDKGQLCWDEGLMEVTDAQWIGDRIVLHIGEVKRGSLRLGDEVNARVNESLRRATERNHTATHLIHAALRRVLGDHVSQAGSVVDPYRLRFDFTHFEALTDEQIAQVEDIANEQVLLDKQVEKIITDLDTALSMGAIALFDEKYGETVRVVRVPDYSMELCGGTHVRRTGEIGVIRIISESSVAAGTRRIEALTGMGAFEHLRRREKTLLLAASRLSAAPEDVPERVEAALSAVREAEKRIAEARRQAGAASLDELLSKKVEIGGVPLVVTAVEGGDADTLRTLADRVVEKLRSGAVLLGTADEGKVILVAKASKDLVERGFHAGNLVKEAAVACGGGGGGRPDFAQAGGKHPEKLQEALEKGKEAFAEQIGAS